MGAQRSQASRAHSQETWHPNTVRDEGSEEGGRTLMATATKPARTWQEQVANIQRNLAAKTMSCDRDTHRVNNPIWEEEKP
jgi:hypothetical protein